MDDFPDPFQPLLDDHTEFVDKLRELEATLDEMMVSRKASAGNLPILDEALRFFEEELLPHLRKEDEVVLPLIEAKIGRFGTMVNVIVYEHEEVRREISKFEEAREDLNRPEDPWPGIQELNRHGIFMIQFLLDHFRKEKASLFPVARRELSADELEEVRRRLSQS